MDNKNLSLEGLIFEAIELSVENNIMSITLNRPEKKNAINPVMANEIIYSLAFAAPVSYTHLTLPTNREV